MASSTPIIAASGSKSTALSAGRLCTLPQSALSSASQLDSARHSLQQPTQQAQLHFGSPVQDPRVTKVISQSQGFSPSSPNQSNPSGVRPASFYAASAPSNSPRSNRPPVPLFNHSAENISSRQNLNTQQAHRRVMSTSNIPLGFPEYLDFSTDLLVEELMESPGTASFTSVNEPGSNQVTVSPKDLMLDATSSLPPSGCLTNISTPPSFDSPGYFSQNTSPMFFNDADLPDNGQWASLFPQSSVEDVEKPAMIPDLPTTGLVASSPVVKNSSSTEGSPRSGRPSTRHSSVSGVKARHREKPLPAIEYDANDPTAAKRARNTEAARKSRARKVEYQLQMETRIAELEAALEESRRNETYWKSLAEAKQ
ncbi:hypothetical protein FQN50_003363 [Emmonsiellopsis sp. PD_5]|nr:hypothetical protein FQN50_003363 [Emmonsiellopsis sp. PD_5]